MACITYFIKYIGLTWTGFSGLGSYRGGVVEAKAQALGVREMRHPNSSVPLWDLGPVPHFRWPGSQLFICGMKRLQ